MHVYHTKCFTCWAIALAFKSCICKSRDPLLCFKFTACNVQFQYAHYLGDTYNSYLLASLIWPYLPLISPVSMPWSFVCTWSIKHQLWRSSVISLVCSTHNEYDYSLIHSRWTSCSPFFDRYTPVPRVSIVPSPLAMSVYTALWQIYEENLKEDCILAHFPKSPFIVSWLHCFWTCGDRRLLEKLFFTVARRQGKAPSRGQNTSLQDMPSVT